MKNKDIKSTEQLLKTEYPHFKVLNQKQSRSIIKETLKQHTRSLVIEWLKENTNDKTFITRFEEWFVHKFALLCFEQQVIVNSNALSNKNFFLKQVNKELKPLGLSVSHLFALHSQKLNLFSSGINHLTESVDNHYDDLRTK